VLLKTLQENPVGFVQKKDRGIFVTYRFGMLTFMMFNLVKFPINNFSTDLT